LFCVSPPPCFAIIEGVFIHAFLGQAEHQETKMDIIGGSRTKRARLARPGQGPTPHVLVWPLGLISLTYSPPGASRGEILTPEKS
jgi:hypothetical protein